MERIVDVKIFLSNQDDLDLCGCTSAFIVDKEERIEGNVFFVFGDLGRFGSLICDKAEVLTECEYEALTKTEQQIRGEKELDFY